MTIEHGAAADQTAPKTAVVVLGMHRSGTSMVTGTLARLGVHMPMTLMAADNDNPKGYYESLAVMAANDAILAQVGSSWRDWSPTDLSHPDAATLPQLRQVLQSEFEDRPLIGIKDPRICRLAPLWFQALVAEGYVPKVILPFRHPLEVVASLTSRNRMSRSEAMLLWLRHVLDAEVHSRPYPRVILDVGTMAADWRPAVEKISTRLELACPPELAASLDESLGTFIDHALLHHRSESAAPLPGPLNSWARAIFGALLRLAEGPDDRKAQAVFDRRRKMFDKAAAIFAPAFFTQAQDLAAARHTIQDQQVRIANLEAPLPRSDAETIASNV